MKYEIIDINKSRNTYMERYQLSNAEELSNIERRPAVIVMSGGGYQFQSEREGEPVGLSYLAEGYNVFILHYSVAEHAMWPNPLEDIDTAIGMIREHACDWQIESDKICTVGFSAGAHLSLAVSTMGKNRPNAEIVGYPATLSEFCDNPIMKEKMIPGIIEYIDENTPPTFIYATMTDELVPVENSIKLIEALNKANVDSEIHIFRSGCHGQSLSKPHISNGLSHLCHPEQVCWFEMSVNFLKGIFGEFPTMNDHPHWKLIGGGLNLNL